MQDEWRSAWEAALDEIELTVEAAERLLGGGYDGPLDVLEAAWRPPQVPGPMPVDLRTRALALLHRQHGLIAATAQATAEHRQQLALLDRIADSGATRAARPVYVDTTA